MVAAIQRGRAARARALGRSLVALLVGLAPALAQASVAGDARTNDNFGRALVWVGDELLVGAPGDNDVAFNGGAVYVYRADGGSLRLVDKLRPTDARGHAWFGSALASDGERLLISAVEPFDLSPEHPPQRRSAWVFGREGDRWVEEACLKSDDPEALADEFGVIAAIEGDRAAIVNNHRQVGNSFGDAQVDVYARAGGQWTRRARLAPKPGAESLEGALFVGDELLVSTSAGLVAYAEDGDTWAALDEPALVDVSSRAIVAIPGDVPRIAAVQGLGIAILRRAGAWAVEATIDLPASTGPVSGEPLAASTSRIVVLREDYAAPTQTTLALTFDANAGSWEGVAVPIVHQLRSGGQGAIAVTQGRLALGFPYYAEDSEELHERGIVFAYEAAGSDWGPPLELLPATFEPAAGGCAIDPARPSSPSLATLLLIAAGWARRRRR